MGVVGLRRGNVTAAAMVAKQKTLSDFFWTAFDYMFLDKMKK